MTYPLVQDLATEGFPVRLTWGVSGFWFARFRQVAGIPVQ